MWLILFLLSSALPSSFGSPCDSPLADPLYDVTVNSEVVSIDQKLLESQTKFEYLSCQQFGYGFFVILAKWEGRPLGMLIGRRNDTATGDEGLLQAWLDQLDLHVGRSLIFSKNTCKRSLFCGVLKRISLRQPETNRAFLFSAVNLADALIAKKSFGFKSSDMIEFGTRMYWNETEKSIQVESFGNETILGPFFRELGSYSNEKLYCVQLDNPVRISDFEFKGYGQVFVKEGRDFCYNLETVFPDGTVSYRAGLTLDDAAEIMGSSLSNVDSQHYKLKISPYWNKVDYTQFGYPFYDFENPIHYRLMGCKGSEFCYLKMGKQTPGPCIRSRFYQPKDTKKPLCPVAFDARMHKFISFDCFEGPVVPLKNQSTAIDPNYNITLKLKGFCGIENYFILGNYSTVLIFAMAEPGKEREMEKQIFEFFKKNKENYPKAEIANATDTTFEKSTLMPRTTTETTNRTRTTDTETATLEPEAVYCEIGNFTMDASMKRTINFVQQKKVSADAFCFAKVVRVYRDKRVDFSAIAVKMEDCTEGAFEHHGFCSRPHKLNDAYSDNINITLVLIHEEGSAETFRKRVCPRLGQESVKCTAQCYVYLDEKDRISSGCSDDLSGHGLACRLRSGKSTVLNDECAVVMTPSNSSTNNRLYDMQKLCCIQPRDDSDIQRHYYALELFMRNRTNIRFTTVTADEIYGDFIEDNVTYTYMPRPTSFLMGTIFKEFNAVEGFHQTEYHDF